MVGDTSAQRKGDTAYSGSHLRGVQVSNTLVLISISLLSKKAVTNPKGHENEFIGKEKKKAPHSHSLTSLPSHKVGWGENQKGRSEELRDYGLR